MLRPRRTKERVEAYTLALLLRLGRGRSLGLGRGLVRVRPLVRLDPLAEARDERRDEEKLAAEFGAGLGRLFRGGKLRKKEPLDALR